LRRRRSGSSTTERESVEEAPVEKRSDIEIGMNTLHAGWQVDGKSYAVAGGRTESASPW